MQKLATYKKNAKRSSLNFMQNLLHSMKQFNAERLNLHLAASCENHLTSLPAVATLETIEKTLYMILEEPKLKGAPTKLY